MPVLAHECDGAVVKHRHYHGTTRMMHDVPLVGFVALADGIDRYSEYAAVKDLFASENLGRDFVGFGHVRFLREIRAGTLD